MMNGGDTKVDTANWFFIGSHVYTTLDSALVYKHLLQDLGDKKYLKKHPAAYLNPLETSGKFCDISHASNVASLLELVRRTFRVFAKKNGISYGMRVYNDTVTFRLFSKEICAMTTDNDFIRHMRSDVNEFSASLDVYRGAKSCQYDCANCDDWRRRCVKVFYRLSTHTQYLNGGSRFRNGSRYMRVTTPNAQLPLNVLLTRVFPDIVEFSKRYARQRFSYARAVGLRDYLQEQELRQNVITALNAAVADNRIGTYGAVDMKLRGSVYYVDVSDVTTGRPDGGLYNIPLDVRVPSGLSVCVYFNNRYYYTYLRRSYYQMTLPASIQDVIANPPSYSRDAAPEPTPEPIVIPDPEPQAVPEPSPPANPYQEQFNSILATLRGGTLDVEHDDSN